MELGLAGHRAMVCGASRGIGAAIAETLAQEGVRVALVARSAEALLVRSEQIGGVPVVADLSTREGPATAVSAAANALSGLDLLVVNSGGPPKGWFTELSEEQWQLAVDGTLLAAIRLIGAALPWLRGGRDAAILVVLSSSVREPIDGLDTSNVLRPGLASLVKSLAVQLAPIRVNGLLPGKVLTDRVAQLDAERAASQEVEVATARREAVARIPLGRYGLPVELGRVATFLCSPAARYVSGVNLAVDGGMIRSVP